jgi:pre-rRNA-processing protein TSR1
MVCSGEFIKNDPLQIILKRKILTGYPSKINKRKAICNMMFFNQKDIKFF